ncbi:UNKNOWN [Stylonychia lemnae]|uniref:Uncharacterized protein n=1 Tax=Stylonychia lemnae TaxID=5949 RepID=A0A078ANF1_STYLE|nr:UNKNOWN [Stylonychia lemnae]|eukprot:CDW82483.1 UNKNOWN [Stylonychia lemnae]
MLNKLDFESALQQDKGLFGANNQLNIHIPQASNKPNLFGPNPNLASGGFVQNNDFQNQSQEVSGKSKRDLLWEQKRKQKLDIVNPGMNKDNGGGAAGLLDQMNPASRQKFIMPQANKTPTIDLAPQNFQRDPQPQQDFNFPNQQNNQFQPQNLPPPMAQINYPHQQIVKQESNDGWMQAQQVRQNIQIALQQQDPFFNPQPIIERQTPNQFQMQNNGAFNQPQSINQNEAFKNNSFQQQNSNPYGQQQIQFEQKFNAPAPIQNFQPISTPSYQQQPQNIQFQQPQQQQQQPQSNQNDSQRQQQVMLQMQEEKAQKQKEYLMQIQNEIKEKEEKKKREKEDRIRREREELQKNMNYNPFGKGGAGAPVRDNLGNVQAQRKPVQDNGQNQQRQQMQQSPYQNQMMIDPYQGMMNPQQQFQQNMIMPQINQQVPQYMQADINPMVIPQILPAQNIQMPMNNFQIPPPIGQPQPFNQIDIQSSPYQQFGNPKMRAPDPSLQFQNDAFKDLNKNQAQPTQDQANSLGIGAYNEFDKERQKDQKKQLNDVLRQQMEEQKRRKEEEQRKKKEEEAREEERIRKERQKMEDEFKQEENKKKAKFSEIQQENAKLVENKGQPKKRVQIAEDNFQNFVVDKPGKKVDIFGQNQSVINPLMNDSLDHQTQNKGNRQQSFQLEQPSPGMNQTRIISEISNELKTNFREEIGKLREEMNSQQRAFREQLERLKVETNHSNHQKQDALSEIEKVKAELKAQREAERLQEQKLFTALDKHNPHKPPAPLDLLNNYDKPGGINLLAKPQIIRNDVNSLNQGQGFPGSQQMLPEYNNGFQLDSSYYNHQRKVGGSRQESRDSQRKKEINNYEKMFFNNVPNKSQSQSRDQQQRPQYNLKEEKLVQFNQDLFNPDLKTYNPYDQQQYQPKIMKRGDSMINNVKQIDLGESLDGQSSLLPIGAINGNQKMNQIPEQKQVQQMPQQKNPYSNPFEKENKQNNGYSYFEQLRDLGAGNVRLDTQSNEDTMDFIERIVNGGEKKPKKDEGGLADKLDIGINFNLPQIPPYEGIQTQILKNDYNKVPQFNQNNSNKQQIKQQSFPTQYNETPDIFSQGLGVIARNNPDVGKSLGLEGTMNTMGTLNSINLENLNKRNEDRMAKLGQVFTDLDLTQNTQVNFGDVKNYELPSKYQNNFENYNSGNQQRQYQQEPKQEKGGEELKNFDNLLFDLLKSDPKPSNQDMNRISSSQGRIPHINSKNSQQNLQMMRQTKDQFMAPKLGLINEDGGEEFEGTFKAYKGGNNENLSNGNAFKMPSDIRRYDSFLDTTNLELH